MKEYGAAVVGLTMDDSGIPPDAASRIAVAKKIVERAESYGIPREDILIDSLVLGVCSDSNAAKVTLETINGVRQELGVNLTLGASNVSFGLPDREAINSMFLAMAIQCGVNAPIVNPRYAYQTILISDLLLGHDEFAMNYIRYYRKRTAAG